MTPGSRARPALPVRKVNPVKMVHLVLMVLQVPRACLGSEVSWVSLGNAEREASPASQGPRANPANKELLVLLETEVLPGLWDPPASPAPQGNPDVRATLVLMGPQVAMDPPG